MARTGSFGRLPKTAPDLTSTLVSMAREMQDAEDSDIMSAWKSGGLFEGEPATDEKVIAYWKQRLGQVDKKDPLYDTYSELIDQTEYTIAESKMTTALDQHKISYTQAAQFYLNWAKKIAPDSEFYRVLQRDAAQSIKSAQAQSTTNSRNAQITAYNNAQDRLYNSGAGASDTLMGVLTTLMQHGVSDINNGGSILGTGQNSINNFDPSDPGSLMQLLSRLNQPAAAGRGGPNATAGGGEAGSTILYYVDSQGNYTTPALGKPFTYSDLVAKMTKSDPNFHGQFTIQYVTGLFAKKDKALQGLLANAVKMGDAAGVKSYKSQIADNSDQAVKYAAVPILAAADQAYSAFATVWNSNATIIVKHQALLTYQKELTGYAQTPGIDTGTANRLTAAAALDPNETNISEDPFGIGPQGGGVTDNAKTAASASVIQSDLEQVALGKAVWGYGTQDLQTGQITLGTGTQLVPIDVTASQDTANYIPVAVPDGLGGTQVVYTKITTVTGSFVDQNGIPVGTSSPTAAILGQSAVLVDPHTGVATTYYRKDAQSNWTTDSPYAHENVVGSDSHGNPIIKLGFDSNNPDSVSAFTDGSNGATFTPDKTDPTKGTIEISDAGLAGASTDKTNHFAGTDPNTSNPSLTALAFRQNLINNAFSSTLVNSATTQAVIAQEAKTYATDPATGNFDLTKYNDYIASANTAMSPANVGHIYNPGDDNWNKDFVPAAMRSAADQAKLAAFYGTTTTTAPGMVAGADGKSYAIPGAPGGKPLVPMVAPPSGAPAPTSKVNVTYNEAGVPTVHTTALPTTGNRRLPSTVATGSGFDHLAQIFKPGTNQLVTVDKSLATGPTFNLHGRIAVPNVPQINTNVPPLTAGNPDFTPVGNQSSGSSSGSGGGSTSGVGFGGEKV